jgi:hypothetical protein
MEPKGSGTPQIYAEQSSTYALVRERWRAVALGRKITEAPTNIRTDN